MGGCSDRRELYYPRSKDAAYCALRHGGHAHATLRYAGVKLVAVAIPWILPGTMQSNVVNSESR